MTENRIKVVGRSMLMLDGMAGAHVDDGGSA